MTIRLLVLLGFFTLNIFLALWLPWRDELLFPTCGALGAGAVIYFVGRLAHRALSRRRQNIRQPPPSSTRRDVHRRTAVVVALFVAVATGLMFGLPRIVNSRAVGEGSYYLSLLLLGAFLARWAGASEAATFTVVVATTLGFIAIELAMFVADPGARSQYGPEIWLFAAGNYAGRIALLPVDLGVALGVWHMARASGPTVR